MLLGLAIGDALGNTSEGMLPRERITVKYGTIYPIGTRAIVR